VEPLSSHANKVDRLIAAFASAKTRGAKIALAKSTSNLFRHRDQRGTAKIDVRAFNQVLSVDRGQMVAEVEGMTTYEDLVKETLPHGLLPAVVPQLKTITVGGAVSGIGIESSSFRFGLVHETVDEMDVLTGDGKIVTCSPRQNAGLFYGFPNSYGTLGYALRLRVQVIPAGRFVQVKHTRYSDPETYFENIGELCAAADLDYLDGTIFNPGEMYITEGRFTGAAPSVSDYTYMRIYYRSIQQRREDWLTAAGYIWRWDTDWFWCSKQFGLQHLPLRLLATTWALNSRTYQRIMRLAAKVLPDAGKTESVIQDVDIPLERSVEFFRFLFDEIGIRPMWMCPFRSCDPNVTYPLYALDPTKVYINFGFWDTVPTTHEDGYFNRKVERKAQELGGKKGLYSTAWYDEDTFWTIFNRPCYEALKRQYDPDGVFRGLYEKCIGRK
jgi:FAD/FMN-containing dehydrogenase